MAKITSKPKNDQNIPQNPKNDQNTPKNAKKWPKYPWNPKNDQNTPKNLKMTKIPPKPKNYQNPFET